MLQSHLDYSETKKLVKYLAELKQLSKNLLCK